MIKRLYFFPAVILLFNFSVFAEEVPLPEEEAPLSIFSYQIGDENVDLFVSGFWESSISGGLGLTWDSDNSGVKRSSFPGFTDGLLFTQNTDLTISLWLADKYFFETSIIDDYNLNTILFGYDSADENNFLKKIRIGNTDLGTGNYALLSIPEASNDSIGFAAEMGSENSEHQVTVRFDPAEKTVRSFRGRYSLEETRISLTDYIQGMFFILPDDNVENLTVYIEDGPGSYRTATADDAVISAEEGYVFFREPQNRKIAVHYTKNGVAVGDDTLGQGALAADSDGLGNSTGEIDISGTEQFRFSMGDYLGADMGALKLNIDGNTSLLLYNPGIFSPFQLLSIYRIPFDITGTGEYSADAFLVDKGLSTGEKIPFAEGLTEKSVMFVREDSSSLRNPAARYPFADKTDSASIIYGKNRTLYGNPPDMEILIDRYTPAGAYSLGDNVLEGSVEMLVNGRKDNRFSFDPDSGIVTLLFRPGDDDRIDFLYRSRSAAARGGDLIAGTGSRFHFSDSLSAEIGAGLRWNVSGGRYTETSGESPGSILVSAGMKYKKNGLEFSLDTGISFFNPDTTGIFRLEGMNKEGILLPVTFSMLYPAAASSSEPALASASRGKLYYKDYHFYTMTGNSILMNYDWDIPQDQVYPYSDNGRSGPYIAGTNGEIDGNAAVLDYELTSGQWAGGRIPVTLNKEGLDLSETTTITLKMKLINTSGTVGLYIRAGKLKEDLDGDSILDSETADFEKGFDFNPVDPADGVSFLSMKVGGSPDGKSGNSQIDTEDLNGNDFLDEEEPDTFISFLSGTDFDLPSDVWKTVTLKLNPDERSRLRNVTGFEIIISETGGGDASGKLLVGDISFNGTSFVVTPSSGQEVTGDEIEENLSDQPGNSLAEDFPEVRDIFSFADDQQKTGRFSWSGTGAWRASTYVPPADLGDYRKVSFYIKFTSLPDSVTFSAENPSGKGIKFSFTPEVSTGEWHKYTFDYSSGILTADGARTSVSVLNSGIYAEDVQKIEISADCTNTAAGTIYIDEIVLEDPAYGIGTGAVSSFSYSRKGPVLSVKGRDIISDLTFSGQSRAASTNFAAGFSASQGSDLYTYNELSFSFMGIGINGDLSINREENNIYYSPGYRVLIPAGKIRIEDSFSMINGSNTLSVTRENNLSVPYGNLLASGGFRSDYSDNYLIQTWSMQMSGSTGLYRTDTNLLFSMGNTSDLFDGLTLGESIIESYRLAVPRKSENEERKTSLSTDHSLNFQDVSVRIKELFSTSVEGTGSRNLDHKQTIALNVPFTVNRNTYRQWTIEPSYSRSIRISSSMDRDESFFTDISAAAGNIMSQEYYFLSVPFYELIAGRSRNFTESSADLDTAVYVPSAGISFSRKNGNSVKDLFFPTSAAVSLENSIKKEWDTLTDLRKITFQTATSSYNLFGKLGSHPIYTWYQTEEISGKTSLSASFPSYDEMSLTISRNQYLNFIIDRDKSFDIESDFSLSWNDFRSKGTIISSYSRKTPLNNPIRFPVIDPEGEEDSSLLYKDELSFKYNYTGETDETVLNLSVHHYTDLMIGEKGIISFSAGIGISQESVKLDTGGTLRTYSAGIEGGITAKMIF